MNKMGVRIMRNIRRYLVLAVIILIIAGYAVFYYLSNKTQWNDTYVNGNTAGNLYNNGLFCERDGMVYFSNPNDSHYLYSMDLQTGETEKLYEDIASFINADDRYVYYVRNNVAKDFQFSFLHFNTNSLCRYDLKTGKVKILDSAPSIYASLIGNYIYYIHYTTETASTLYRIKIDGSEAEQVDTNPYFTCSANGQYLYYNGIEKDHNIYQMDTATGTSQTICSGNYWMPSADNENIYFKHFCTAQFRIHCWAGGLFSRLGNGKRNGTRRYLQDTAMFLKEAKGMAEIEKAKQIYSLSGNHFMVEQIEIGLDAIKSLNAK